MSVVAQAESEDVQEFSPSDISESQRHLPAVFRRVAAMSHAPFQCDLISEEDEDTDWSKADGLDDIIAPPTPFKDCQPRPLMELLQDGATDVQVASPSSSSSSSSSDEACESNSNDSDFSHLDVSPMTFDPVRESDFIPPSMLEAGSAHSPSHTCADADTQHLDAKVMMLSKHSLVSLIHTTTPRRPLVDWKTISCAHHGFLLHHKLRASRCGYREGEEYGVVGHIHSGCYGDVLCVRDKTSGFTCAAKKLPLSRFKEEEVTAWSVLDSPGVLRLFGAVREGPNAVLFMDLKPASLAQLMKSAHRLPEDLALHFLHQTLGALQHLHRCKVLHLDVKVDNVLLSWDCTHTFLCDFGQSHMLDCKGLSTKSFLGGALPGTETHMAPEVACGARLSAKVDVWSSCCMFLHMLTGHQPWIRRFSQPLCLHIAKEPPPLWEVPPGCNAMTVKVFRAGLRKDAVRRASASQLRRKSAEALRAVGGLRPASVQLARDKLWHRNSAPFASLDTTAPTMHWVSPWRTRAMDEDHDDADSLASEWECQPRSLRDEGDWDADVDIYTGGLRTDLDYEADREDEDEDQDDEESTRYVRRLQGFFPLLQRGRQTHHTWRGSDAQDGVDIRPHMTPSPEPRDDPPSCFSSSSQADTSDQDSERSSDDLSSGVLSYCGDRTECPWSCGPPSRCFQGVDVWIEDAQGDCLRIRERQLVQVGHVAVGISEQVSMAAFTLETLDRKSVCCDWQIQEACLWLRCVPAPDSCRRWTWRVHDGKLQRRP
ncbi:mitogen-activated protein kinase kinase kinase 14 isoform X2 [Nerophis lumbriciformis]|uniref:mitogen-activated protein kinase kinase kinase 14 isoform X2 n=1 Tax=Nerophis lumbriciformis TaxID=546530 RepID=UPI002AE06FDF|nr:mitogen-activated protein kinase kinase kinase 14-like isoform X2 [Nerophis lumbriciformis]